MTSTHTTQDPKALFESLDIEGPVDMFNQLKFREMAQYPDEQAQAACTGKQAFKRYAELLVPVLEEIGGSIKIWRGRVHAEVSKPNDESWDVMTVFRFPSTAALVQLFSNPEFHQVSIHRQAAVSRARTFVCTAE